MSKEKQLPAHARVAIIGGGVVGCSILFHLDAAGLWSREAGHMAGLHLPVQPMEHHYLITEDIPEIAARDREDRLPAGIDLRPISTSVRSAPASCSAPNRQGGNPGREGKRTIEEAGHHDYRHPGHRCGQ